MHPRSFSMFCSALAVFASVAGPLWAGPALDRIRDHGIIVAAADPVWPPFSWRDPIGEYHGFDVEVTREIADRLGVRAEFMAPTWEAQLSGAWDGQWDIAVTNMTPTADREERLVFPAIYTYGQAALAVLDTETDIQAIADLAGKRIGVVEDTIYERYLRHRDMGIPGLSAVTYQIDDPEIVEFADSNASYRLIVEGDVIDAVIDDLLAIKGQIAQGRPIRILGGPLFAAPAAVAIESGDPEFAAEIARIVAEMQADGTLRALSLKWFDIDSSTAGG